MLSALTVHRSWGEDGGWDLQNAWTAWTENPAMTYAMIRRIQRLLVRRFGHAW